MTACTKTSVDLSFMPEGIYFDMPEEEYHALPCLSASGIKDLLISPLQYWSRHLDPDREEQKETTARIVGKAYHKMVLEGAEAFHAAYAVQPEADEFPDALMNGNEIKAHCKALELPASGTIDEMIARIRTVDQNTVIYPEIVKAFKDDAEGKTILDRKTWIEIERSKYILDRMPSVSQAFTGGRPEVTMIWRDNESGALMKCRMDYLRPAGEHGLIVDLKTFSNQMDREPRQAVAREITDHRYDIQAKVYKDALSAMVKLFAEHGTDIVRSGEAPLEWLRATIRKPRFFFVFVQKGIPHIVGREWQEMASYQTTMQPTEYGQTAKRCVSYAKRSYARCMKEYGTDTPWLVDYATEPFRDEDFPIYHFDNVPQEDFSHAD